MSLVTINLTGKKGKTAENGHRNGHAAAGYPTIEPLTLTLEITDPDVINAIQNEESGPVRDRFVQSALKIGVIALLQNQSRIDAETVRHEGEIIIENLNHAFDQHHRQITDRLTASLKEYFDPESGRFNERIKLLIQQDGELERVMRSQVEGENSLMAQTLAAYTGKESPLMRILDPKEPEGLITQFAQSTEKTLTGQQERILREFDLNNDEGALKRMVKELSEKHGNVGEALEKRFGEMMHEFSKDNEECALARLINGIETSHRRIAGEFNLAEEGSALSTMQRKLTEAIEQQTKANTEFQQEVKTALTAMTVQRKEAQKGTRHGNVFEEAVFELISGRSQAAGDIAEATGEKTGALPRNKKGDVVITLGPTHIAAGAKIVVEAKQRDKYTLTEALAEIREARENREAGVGIFVFSASRAPEDLDPLRHYGDDIVVVWDAEDPGSDVYLDAALSVAKALCNRPKGDGNGETSTDLKAVEEAISRIEKDAGRLDKIIKSVGTIERQTKSIRTEAQKLQETIGKNTARLKDKIAGLSGPEADDEAEE